jgi:hypothetical protein
MALLTLEQGLKLVMILKCYWGYQYSDCNYLFSIIKKIIQLGYRINVLHLYKNKGIGSVF